MVFLTPTIPIYKVSMEEARWGAVCPDTFAPVLMSEGKCSCRRAKLAHFVGHLPIDQLRRDGPIICNGIHIDAVDVLL